MKKILIAYASPHGSTKSIAERIKAKLSAAKVGEVRFEPVTKELVIGDTDVLIIGSCIHAQAWLSAAQAFSKQHSEYLKEHKIPVWAFSVGMPPEGKGQRVEEEKLEKWAKGVFGEELKGHTLFQGKWLKKDVWWGFRGVFKWIGGRFGDHRDWTAVEGWADETALQLSGEVREESNITEETVVR